MARNGEITVNDLVVRELLHGQGRSRVIAANGTVTLTIETTAAFARDMNVRPGDKVDVSFDFDK